MASPKSLTISLLLLLGFFLGFSSAIQDQNLTAYEMLEKYNIPRGVIPLGVKSYVLNDDGSFVAHMSESSCKFGIEAGYSLEYKNKITGKLSYGKIKDLQGVSVKVFFLWLSINEVDRGDGQLDFYVGPLSASFPIDNFYVCPQCGCGLDCLTVNEEGPAIADS